MKIKNLNLRYGQTLAELLVAIGLSAIFIGGAVFLLVGFVGSNARSGNVQTAADLANQLLINAQLFTASSWHNLYDLGKGPSNHYYLSTSTSPIASSSGDELITAKGVAFTRYFYVENVSRDSNNNIVSSGGTDDPSTQKITVKVTWTGDANGITLSQYLTRSVNRGFVQSDWSGGSGQELFPASSSVNNSFASSSGMDYSNQGYIKIQGY